VGRVYRQTFIDTYTTVACAKLYGRKTPITAADLVNDPRAVPFFDSHDVKLSDRGSEYCGNPEALRRRCTRRGCQHRTGFAGN
jgi:hypothetical protein